MIAAPMIGLNSVFRIGLNFGDGLVAVALTNCLNCRFVAGARSIQKNSDAMNPRLFRTMLVRSVRNVPLRIQIMFDGADCAGPLY